MTSMNAQERNTAPFTDGTLELKHQNHDTAMYLDENCGDELTDLELEEISGGFFWGFEARPIIDGIVQEVRQEVGQVKSALPLVNDAIVHPTQSIMGL